ncbi:unnamed protein product [Durusdinium trenchii]|uniref:Glycosyltransferase 2-like domain-containing protein n=1 Tax=Durusdinium trenchii TaxID=1381693 RepID=A0ABP0RTP2_9DINO
MVPRCSAIFSLLALCGSGSDSFRQELQSKLKLAKDADTSLDNVDVPLAVEASRCSQLLRAKLGAAPSLGPVIDMGAPSMVTAWLLREKKVVISVGEEGRSRPADAATRPRTRRWIWVTQPLELLLTTLRELFGDREESRIREPPSLLFIEADQLLQRGALQRTSHTLRSVRPLLSDLAVSGVMLSDDGKEVPHWMLPSVLAPVLDAKNKMNIELPCWTIGCTSGLTGGGLALVMIVKNEARLIRQTLQSVLEAADRAVILDTGSTDGTQEILREVSQQQNFPLELYEEPFVDFATTRNRALQLAGQSSEFVLMLSGDETLVHGAQLRRFVTQHSGYCGGSEEVFNVRVFMGSKTWYWSERLMRSKNHQEPGWPQNSSSWRYVGVTHEAYIHPVRTLSNDLFINYIGDTDASQLEGLPEPVAGSFYISHNAERTEEKSTRRLRQDVQLLEDYLNKDDAHLDAWQYTRAIFYLAQSHRSLQNFEVAKELWERYLTSEISGLRQFSYLRYGAHMGLGQICAQQPSLWRHTTATSRSCLQHFEEAHQLCPRAEPMVYLALSMPDGAKERRLALQRAKEVQHLQASTGHCAIFAEESVYQQIDTFIDRLPNGFCRKRNLVDEFGHGYRMTTDDLEDAEGTYVYVKLAQVPRTFQWQTVPGKLHSPQSNRLEEVGVETRPLQESPPGVSLTWCRNLCAMSRLCGCFVYSDVTKKCERFANCQRAIIDPIPRVHTIRGINGELPTVPDYKIPDFHYWIYYKKAEIVGEDALFLEERSCWPMILWAVLLASCCWLCLFLILRVLGRKDRLYEPLEGLPDYNIVLENASKVSRSKTDVFCRVLKSINLRNSSKMTETLMGVLELMFDAEGGVAASSVSKMATPSGATLSRARAKVDLALMIIRRHHWRKVIKDTSIQLGYDATTMSKEMMIAQEHSIP